MSASRYRQLVLLVLSVFLVVGAWAIYQWRHSPAEIDRAQDDASIKLLKGLPR